MNSLSALACAVIAALAPVSVPSFASPYAVEVTAFAKCDGHTDDSEAIRKAIAAAGKGGTVVFPAAVCVIDPARSILLNEVTLQGSGTPHYSDDRDKLSAGSVISIGTAASRPSRTVAPFTLEHGVTLRGINIVYPYQLRQSSGAAASAAPTFTDTGTEPVSNILFDNLHLIGAYTFWVQQDSAPTYGNVRITNSDLFAISEAFDWKNVQETVALSNVISNPSLCGQCSPDLVKWVGDNSIWLHVTGNARHPAVGGIQASNLTVSSYRTGILVDRGGHLDESMFGPTTVFDRVPYALYVGNDGSITHVAMSSKIEFPGTSFSGTRYRNALITLDDPQVPSGAIVDKTTLSLNGLTVDGAGGPVLTARMTSARGGSLTMIGVVARHYCINGPSSAVDIDAPGAAVLIVGSQFTPALPTGCGGLSVTPMTTGSFVSQGNLIGGSNQY